MFRISALPFCYGMSYRAFAREILPGEQKRGHQHGTQERGPEPLDMRMYLKEYVIGDFKKANFKKVNIFYLQKKKDLQTADLLHAIYSWHLPSENIHQLPATLDNIN